MTRNEERALVFGLFETGLGLIRSLGRKGIRIFGVDYKKDIGWYSRYVTPMICPHPVTDRNAFLDWISRFLSRMKTPLPVFVTSDDFLNVLSEERSAFLGSMLMNLPDHSLLESISDKYRQFSLARNAGIPVPGTWLIDDPEDLKTLQNTADWPLLVKGREVNSWRAVFGGTIKGFVAEDYRTLVEKVKPALNRRVPLIVQTIIIGQDSSHYKYCVYISENGRTLAELCLRKIRQWPIRFGVGSAVESVRDDELLTTGRLFFKKIGYQGVGSAEFKRDTRDGKLKLIELNPRYWQQNALAEKCGVDFAWIHYQDLLRREPDPVTKYTTGVKWINRYMDFSSFLAYHREGCLSFRSWRESQKGNKVYPDFSWDDPIPALYEIGFGRKMMRIPLYLWKNLYR